MCIRDRRQTLAWHSWLKHQTCGRHRLDIEYVTTVSTHFSHLLEFITLEMELFCINNILNIFCVLKKNKEIYLEVLFLSHIHYPLFTSCTKTVFYSSRKCVCDIWLNTIGDYRDGSMPLSDNTTTQVYIVIHQLSV